MIHFNSYFYKVKKKNVYGGMIKNIEPFVYWVQNVVAIH